MTAAKSSCASWAYTHHTHSGSLQKIRRLNAEYPAAVNLSADGPKDADRLVDSESGPVVVVWPETDPTWKTARTPKGRRVVRCPAEWRKDLTCATCGNGRPLCARKDRDYLVGFTPHGTYSGKVLAISRVSEPDWLRFLFA